MSTLNNFIQLEIMTQCSILKNINSKKIEYLYAWVKLQLQMCRMTYQKMRNHEVKQNYLTNKCADPYANIFKKHKHERWAFLSKFSLTINFDFMQKKIFFLLLNYLKFRSGEFCYTWPGYSSDFNEVIETENKNEFDSCKCDANWRGLIDNNIWLKLKFLPPKMFGWTHDVCMCNCNYDCN